MTVVREDRGGAAVLTLDSPSNRNALSRRLVETLHAQLLDAAGDPSVRAVVVTATGTTFCSGADLSDPPAAPGEGVSYADVLRVLWGCEKTVVVAVNGHVRAGGFGLLAAGDIVLAVPEASFAFTEVRIGVAPAIIAVLCQRRMTPATWSRYLLTGERFDAAAAQRSGLVGAVVAPGGLDAAVDELLVEVRQTEPGAVAATKALLRRLPALDVDAGLRLAETESQHLFASPAAAEGIAAFKERRPPAWAVH